AYSGQSRAPQPAVVTPPGGKRGMLSSAKRQTSVAIPVRISRSGMRASIRVPVLVAFALSVLLSAGILADTDVSGGWTVVRCQDNTENPWVGDFVGLPLNEAGLARAESWDASLLSLPEYQCRPHGWAYISRGPTQLRISKEIDPFTRELVAYQPEWHQ